MISRNRGLVLIYVAPPLFASFEDFQELFIMGGIVSFSSNILFSGLGHRLELFIMLLQQYSFYRLVQGMKFYVKWFYIAW